MPKDRFSHFVRISSLKSLRLSASDVGSLNGVCGFINYLEAGLLNPYLVPGLRKNYFVIGLLTSLILVSIAYVFGLTPPKGLSYLQTDLGVYRL